MTPEGKAWVTRAFEALGPERVARGLEAVGHTWSDCFLAIAIFGEVGALARELAQGATRASSGRSLPSGWRRTERTRRPHR